MEGETPVIEQHIEHETENEIESGPIEPETPAKPTDEVQQPEEPQQEEPQQDEEPKEDDPKEEAAVVPRPPSYDNPRREIVPEAAKPVAIEPLDPTDAVIAENTNEFIRLYLDGCASFDVKPNSKIMTMLKGCDGNEECVDISTNYIGDRGMIAFAHALSKHESLVELNFAGNGIRNKGAQAICEMIKGSNTIQHLNLANNCLSKTAGKAIVEVIATCPNLQTVNVSNNKIDPDTRLKIMKALSRS
ncbi:Leucine Rich repeat [Carpediemonas membranifera]|uniref:Leucine Rich repeat n=1 Tax=Carpediemonas membranifera TaxID=201153 RepID=A0A8J6B1A8_9EUKA|nr:Leucine Rich repeat [Carpediemonas membranifera]|eukprot:KAG9396315.1 Leucine Rich repeat [Carpediemonas membranifera]